MTFKSIHTRAVALGYWLDAFQKRHAVLSFPVAVWKKLEDDQVGNLAALLTFYAFVSFFPLLLLLTIVLGVVLRLDPGLQQRVLNSALVDFPVIGAQLKNNVHNIGRGGAGYLVSIVGLLLGARGLANATQDVLNRLWGVPSTRRPGFPDSWLRSYGIVAVIGLGMLAATALSVVGTWAGKTAFGVGLRIAILAVSLAVTIGLTWLGLRLATASEVPGRDLRIGALVAAVTWQAMQWLGGLIVAHQLRHASALYGVFGLVLGLIAWLYLQARLTLYAVTIDVVRARHAWPCDIFTRPDDTPAHQDPHRDIVGR